MTKTINGLTVTTSAASGDLLAIWRAANSDTRKITKANFMGGVLTGAGTVATGGFTLTVPATGTASLLGTAQTYTALKTFSAGIAFANETLSTYDEGTWTPAIEGTGSNPTITYTTQLGHYWRINNLVFYNINITINTFSGGTGDARITLPYTSATTAVMGTLVVFGVDVSGTPFGTAFSISAGSATGSPLIMNDNASASAILISGFAAGDTIRASGFYMTS